MPIVNGDRVIEHVLGDAQVGHHGTWTTSNRRRAVSPHKVILICRLLPNNVFGRNKDLGDVVGDRHDRDGRVVADLHKGAIEIREPLQAVGAGYASCRRVGTEIADPRAKSRLEVVIVEVISLRGVGEGIWVLRLIPPERVVGKRQPITPRVAGVGADRGRRWAVEDVILQEPRRVLDEGVISWVQWVGASRCDNEPRASIEGRVIQIVVLVGKAKRRACQQAACRQVCSGGLREIGRPRRSGRVAEPQESQGKQRRHRRQPHPQDQDGDQDLRKGNSRPAPTGCETSDHDQFPPRTPCWACRNGTLVLNVPPFMFDVVSNGTSSLVVI